VNETLAALNARLDAAAGADANMLPRAQDLARSPLVFRLIEAQGEHRDDIQPLTPTSTRPAWTPVSMAWIGGRRFIVADYNHLYLVDEAEHTVADIARPKGLAMWIPTAVHYSSFYDLLFVANYTGNDILIFHLSRGAGAGISLELSERIHDHVDNAEGVSVSADGRYMAIANEGDITLFERESGAWKYRWSQKFLAAHGVTIIGGQVFASGKSLAAFDLTTGKPLANASRIGEKPIEFATCINDAGDGNLIVSDTVAGYVAEVDRKFHLIARVGENGPGLGKLDMPYCVHRFAGRTFITSTMQARIVVHGPAGTQSWFTQPFWQYENEPATTIQRIPDDSSGGSSNWSTLSLFGLKVSMSYRMFKRLDGGGFLSPPLRQGLFGYPWEYYWLTAVQKDNISVILANSSAVALIYDQARNAMGEIQLGETGCWALGDRVLCPSRAFTLQDLRSRALMLDPNNVLAILFDEWGRPIPAGRNVLEPDLDSQAARIYVRAASAACTPDELDKARVEYEKAIRTSITPLVEYWLVSVISGRQQFPPVCKTAMTAGSLPIPSPPRIEGASPLP
jgi:hypothetical protein